MRSSVLLGVIVLICCCQPARAEVDPPRIPLPTFQWGLWTFEVSPAATLNRQYVSFNGLDEIEALTREAQQQEQRRLTAGAAANRWNMVYALCPESDMVYLDQDGTRYRQIGGMGSAELAWARESLRQFCDAAYAYSRGAIRIQPTEVVMQEPMLGEYEQSTFFWSHDWSDLGVGIDTRNFDSVTAHFFPGQVRPWSHGAAGGADGDWTTHLGISRAQLSRERETGKPFTLTAIVSLHEWLHLVASMRERSGYIGMPSQYSPGNVADGSHLYWMRHLLTPAMLQRIHWQAPCWAPPNKPTDRFEGFIGHWLVAGPFDLPAKARSNEAMLPAYDAFDSDPFDITTTLPDRNSPTGVGQVQWTEVQWEFDTDLHKTNVVNLRKAFPGPQRDAICYAHAYINSPDRRDAILWLSGQEPAEVFLNGKPVLTVWRGVAEDDASRHVTLLPGWNRLLIKKLDQEAQSNWNLGARFTDVQQRPFTDLQFAHNKPTGDIVATTDAVDPKPIQVRHVRWTDVQDDLYGRLPILNEQNFDALFGQTGTRLLAAPMGWNGRELRWETEKRWLMLDVSRLKGIQSRIVSPDAAYATIITDTQLNNVFNLMQDASVGRIYEGMLVVRYTRPDGSIGDLVCLRPDVAELFMDWGRYPEGWTGPKHAERLIGFICRDTVTMLCFDTNVGDPLPANELDMFEAQDSLVQLAAGPKEAVVLRGTPCNIACRLRAAQNIKGHFVLREERGATLLERDVELTPAAPVEIAFPLDTRSRPAGLLTLRAEFTYQRDNASQVVAKPVCIPVSDPVTLKTRVEGAELLTTPQQELVITVTNNLPEAVSGKISPRLPAGWKVAQPEQPFKLQRLNDTQTFRFKVTINDSPDGPLEIGATARLDGRNTPPAEDTLPVYKHFAPTLLKADFENGVDGDFAIVNNGIYDVQLYRSDPAVGKACLQMSDQGGQRFGHIFAFGAHAFRPPEVVPPDTQYSYDTRVYPLVDFWFKTAPENRDDNLALHIELDDTENGYGVLINGLWDQQWGNQILLGTAPGFVADGQWHHVVFNLDEMLDGYLGDTSHHVVSMYIGDTRKHSSGWYSDYNRHHHYLDCFQIRRDGDAIPTPAEVAANGLPRYSRLNRVPPFESKSVNDLKATLRLNALGYFPWQEPVLQLWLTNQSKQNSRIATSQRQRLWQVRITTEKGEVVRDWTNAYADPNRQPHDGEPNAPGDFRFVQAGQSHYEENVELTQLLGPAQRQALKLQPGAAYIIQARYLNTIDGADFGPAAWTGTVETNPVRLVMYPVPTDEENLAALQTSVSVRRRAQAAAQLGKAKRQDAMPALIQALASDRDADVRLNAAWALGEMGRFKPGKDEANKALAPAIDALIKALNDENYRVAEYAGQSLGKLGDPRAAEALIAQLDSPRKWTRRRTYDALRTLEDPQTLPRIAKGMQDKSREVRKQALEALIGLAEAALKAERIQIPNAPKTNDDAAPNAGAVQANADQPNPAMKGHFEQAYKAAAVAAKDEYHYIRQMWAEALPRFVGKADVLPDLIAGLNDDSSRVRAAALTGLNVAVAQAKDRKELPALRERLAPINARMKELLSDYWTEVRQAAVTAYEPVTGTTLEETTGHDGDYWLRRFPRPNDPRTPGLTASGKTPT